MGVADWLRDNVIWADWFCVFVVGMGFGALVLKGVQVIVEGLSSPQFDDRER